MNCDATQGMPMDLNRDHLIVTFWFGRKVIKLQGNILLFKLPVIGFQQDGTSIS